MYEQEIPGDAAHERVLSIVVPCYNEEESIPLFYRETRKAANELRQRLRVQVEYVFVDDGSTDSTLDILKKLRAQDKQVHYVSFSRNFGKESPYTRDCARPMAISWPRLTPTCRIRRPCSPDDRVPRRARGLRLRRHTS